MLDRKISYFPIHPDTPSDNILITPNTVISCSSVFEDNIWIFDVNKERTLHISGYEMSINWKACYLPEPLILLIKIFTFYFNFYPELVITNSSNSKKKRKAITVCATAKRILKFFHYLYKSNISKSGFEYIREPKDINKYNIQDALNTSSFNIEHIRNYLLMMSSKELQDVFPYKLSLSINDIKSLQIRTKAKKLKDRTIDERNLIPLIQRSTENIYYFMNQFNLVIEDKSLKDCSLNDILSNEMFEDYKYIWSLHTKKERSNWEKCILRFKNKYKKNHREISDFLYKVQISAQIIILMYTGIRASEAISLKVSCLVKENSKYLIKGTLIKGQGDFKSTNKDKWIAIPIVVDAIRCLEKINEINGSEFLFTGFLNQGNVKKGKPFFTKTLNRRINKSPIILGLADFKLTSHMFRHTFIKLLQEDKLNIAYISIHVKHLQDSFLSLPSDTTASYGNYISNLIDDSTNKRANQFNHSLELVPKVSTIDNVYFDGLTLSKEEEIKYTKRAKDKEIDLIKTNVGLCSFDFKNLVSANIENPICLSGEDNFYIISTSILPKLYSLDLGLSKKLKDKEYNYIREKILNKKEKLSQVIKRLEAICEKED